ncbi:MAG: hypothetical protein NZ888_06355 [Candidatus Nitrosocaldus sp.]|nr:hypothetical protein [Candidatus Nitrosocaldus sp.]MCS7141789.1 hypothetical protein [Candidatus Nitrosocaldus sp.]
MNMNRILTQFIDRWHKNDESRLVLIYGTAGVGKSSYAIQTCLELETVYNYNYKDFIIFKPKEFIDRITYLIDNSIKIPALIWDDAGVWLYKLDYQDEFVKSAVKFFNVARTVVSCIILTTISPHMLVTNLRKMDMLTIKVVRRGHNNTSLARCYSANFTPNGYRLLKTVFEDEFKRHMPDNVYTWYSRLRADYVKEALDLMKKSLKQTQIDNNLEEYYLSLLNEVTKEDVAKYPSSNNSTVSNIYSNTA